MEPRTQLLVLKNKVNRCTDDEHASAFIIDLEDKKAEPFIIDLVEPTHANSRNYRLQGMSYLKMIFSEAKSDDDAKALAGEYRKSLEYKNNERYRKLHPHSEDISKTDDFQKDLTLEKFKSWQQKERETFDIATIYSACEFKQFKKDYIKKFGDFASKKEDYFTYNFGVMNNCSTPVWFAMNYLSEATAKDCAYTTYEALCCLFGFPWVLTCCPKPPCIDWPGSLMTHAGFRAKESRDRFFKTVEDDKGLKEPLLSSNSQAIKTSV